MEAPDSDKREDDRWDGAVNQFVAGLDLVRDDKAKEFSCWEYIEISWVEKLPAVDGDKILPLLGFEFIFSWLRGNCKRTKVMGMNDSSAIFRLSSSIILDFS